MSPPSEEFEAYLAPGESVVAGTAGTLFDDAFRSAGVVGVTDRRVLFVSEAGGFLDVAHDAVSSIRSRPRREFTYRGLGPTLVAVLGSGVAVAAFAAVLALEPGVVGFVLALATVGGAATAERVRRVGGGPGWHTLDEARAALVAAVDDVGPLRGPLSGLQAPLSGFQEALAEARVGGDPDLLVLGIASASLTAMVGLVAATETLLVVPLLLVTVGGVALAEHGYRRQRERDVARGDRPTGRDVSIHLADGRVVLLRLDRDVGFDRDLSAALRESAPPTATAELSSP